MFGSFRAGAPRDLLSRGEHGLPVVLDALQAGDPSSVGLS